MQKQYETDLSNKENELEEKTNSLTKIEKLKIKLEKKIQLNEKSNLKYQIKEKEFEFKQKENEIIIFQLKKSNNKLLEKINSLTNQINNEDDKNVDTINNNNNNNNNNSSSNNGDIKKINKSDNDTGNDNDNDNDNYHNNFGNGDIIIITIQKVLKAYYQKNKYQIVLKQKNLIHSISKSEIIYESQMIFFVQEYLKPIQELNIIDEKLINHILKILEKMTSISIKINKDLTNIIQSYHLNYHFKNENENENKNENEKKNINENKNENENENEESKEKSIYKKFHNYINEMVIYISYFQDITKFNSILKIKLTEEDTIKQLIIHKKKKFPKKLNLFELVIMPIKRLTVYSQFFRDLSKIIDKKNIDYTNIQNSLKRIRKYRSAIKKFQK